MTRSSSVEVVDVSWTGVQGGDGGNRGGRFAAVDTDERPYEQARQAG